MSANGGGDRMQRAQTAERNGLEQCYTRNCVTALSRTANTYSNSSLSGITVNTPVSLVSLAQGEVDGCTSTLLQRQTEQEVAQHRR
ncbi:hypothetical protein HaLaN_32776, partial [Haematococcus lacustris]